MSSAPSGRAWCRTDHRTRRRRPSMTTPHEGTRLSAADALEQLIEGNQRFLRGEARSSAFRRETLTDLVRAQRPYATVLGCSDSRVPPEWIFDVGLGGCSSSASQATSSRRNRWNAAVCGVVQNAVVRGPWPRGCRAITAALATERGETVSFPAGCFSATSSPAFRRSIRRCRPRNRRRAPLSNVRWTVRQIWIRRKRAWPRGECGSSARSTGSKQVA